ncbi:hypothetical protein GQX74_002688 [Glossina fuscipes]|uniref:Uncharacterized protein n=1 Tax=Glossina palpalis gambiensis TaxID=67801 RepID=A0A1B0BYX8_9MUSC|nr:hypothetical protein GQX74_002688 [Glossina fuscipes]
MFGVQKCSRILKRNDLETVRRHNEFSAGAILTSVAICFAQNWKKVNFKVCDSSKHYTCVYAWVPVKQEKSYVETKNIIRKYAKTVGSFGIYLISNVLSMLSRDVVQKT